MNIGGLSRRDSSRLLEAMTVAWVLLFVLAANVSAQTDGTQPGGIQIGGTQIGGTQPGGTQPGGTEPGGPQAAMIKPWTFRVGVNEVFEDNVQLTSGGGGDLGSRVDVGVGRYIKLPAATVRFSGDAGQLFYRELTNLNQLTYGAGASVSYLVTRRLTWDIGDTYSSNYAQDTRVLTDAGLVFPKVVTRSNTAGTQFAYDLTPRSQVRASIGAQSVFFDSSELTGMLNVTTRVSLVRQLNRTQSAGFSWDRTMSNSETGDIQGLLGTWQGTLGRAVTFNATGGVRPYKSAGQSGFKFAPSESVGIAARFSRSSVVAAHYEHTVEQTFGFGGVHLSDQFGGSYTLTAGRHVTVDGSASYGLNTDPVDPDFRLVGKTVFLGVRYLVATNLTVSGLYSVWMSKTGVDQDVQATRVGVSLSYGLAWR